MWRPHFQYINVDMNTAWVSDPVTAYYDWQLREAAGADRRPFSRQSIAQHCAMFDRFLRHLVGHGETLASFGPDHVDAFWQTEGAKEYGPATRMRYLKLIDRLCRHLVSIGLRRSNPADEMVRAGRWPDGDPDPIYLPLAADLRLQAHVAPSTATTSPGCEPVRSLPCYSAQALPQPSVAMRCCQTFSSVRAHPICTFPRAALGMRALFACQPSPFRCLSCGAQRALPWRSRADCSLRRGRRARRLLI